MSESLKKIEQLALELGCAVEENPLLSKLTTFRIGGAAPLLIQVNGQTAQRIQHALLEEQIPYFWIGKGSNLLVGDQGVSSVLLQFTTQEEPIVKGNCIHCSAGTPMKTLCRVACEHELTGMEFAYGIPGTVGGGVYMNAGAYGGDVSQVIETASILFPDGSVKQVSKDQLGLSYRHSFLMDNGGVVLDAQFRLTEDREENIRERMNDFLSRRKEKQPLEYPSAGSFFKRPEGYFAGALIEQCGLKGYRVGDAQISEKHAGFLINRGQATCADVKAVAAEVKRRVLSETGVEMNPEVRLIGDTWEV